MSTVQPNSLFRISLISCQRTLWGEGWLSICYGGSRVHSFRQWVATNCTGPLTASAGQYAMYCAAPPTARAGQYGTSKCKPLLFWFHCKWWYIDVGTFNV